jgi:putative hydrolase
MNLRQDMHVHSTFSDGRDAIEDNVAQAERLELTELGCVDHVRADTAWVPEYAAAVRRVRASTGVRLTCSIEAKLLDTTGALDLPADLDGVEAIFAADHQVPLDDGPTHPREVRERLQRGDLGAEDVLEAIVTATARSLDRALPVVIAHLFSVLPKIGLDEADVSDELLRHLASETKRTGQTVEISERWRCPSARTLRPFAEHGVPIVVSTDSHAADTIGRYEYCTAVAAELGLTGRAAP